MNYINTIKLSKKFANDAHINEDKKTIKKQEQKAMINALFFPNISKYWFSKLQSKQFADYFSYRKLLYIKPYRPYINTNWDKKQVIKVIGDSIEFLEKKIKFANDFKYNKDVVLASVPLKDNTTASVIFHYDYRLRKEGEFTLSLVKDDNRIISLSFSVEKMEDNKFVACVGCVQGHSLDDKNLTKNIHKLMYGIRPKSFIIYVAQMLFKILDCKDILLVDNNSRPHGRKHLIQLPWIHDISFDNDETWKELGAIKSSNGWFKLPLIPQRKPIDEIKSKKRSEYKKRYNLLDDVYSQMEILQN